jgi:potassium/sodium efflux P-type ATPase
MYYLQDYEAVLREFNVDQEIGLRDEQVIKKQQEIGFNELGGDSGPSVWKVLFNNIFNSMNLILFTALVVSISVLDWIKFAVLALVIVTNSGIGFAQEYKSEKTMDALRKMSSPTARVLRNRNWVYVPAREVVPGDLVSIKMGDICPADLRLIESVSLEMDEAFLTGEPVPIAKITGLISRKEDEFVNVGDRINCAFMNSNVIRGRGMGVVIGTGFATEVGKIAKMVTDAESDEKTPLMKSLDNLMYLCAGTAIVLGVVVFASDRFVWSTDTFLYAISVGIAILPEGLPAVVTVALAIGLRGMSKQKALVRKLSALEAVGQVTNICSDKTGTLTEGKMTVKELWADGQSYVITGTTLEPKGEIRLAESDVVLDVNTIEANYALESLFRVASLCNTSKLFLDPDTNTWKAHGDPTEIALNVFATKMGLTKDFYGQQGLVFEKEFAFESAVKRMTSVYKNTDGTFLYLTKGALERVLEVSHQIYENGVSHPLTEDRVQRIHDVMAGYAAKGMRILALATKTLSFHSEKATREQVETELCIVGICAIYDPPRQESLPSVKECHAAGIQVHMATGDHPKTAEAIARDVGILKPTDPSGPPLVLPAHVFDSMTEAEIDEMPELPRVLARCAPSSKVTLINALHRRGKFVAMTGDGVNDAPAVKKADIGIAMGLAGSDVTKQASSITLTDDNFRTIVVAVKEGRRLFMNITNIVQHLLSGNVSEVIVLVIGLALRDTQGNAVFPMSAIQILWLNMITSSPVALALGVEYASEDVMQLPPRRKDQNLASWELNLDLAFFGMVLGMFSLGSFMLYIHYTVGLGNMPPGCGKNYIEGVCDDIFSARALAFISLSLLILVHGFNCRHNRLSIFRKNQCQNKALWFAVVFGFFSTIPTAFIPFINVRMFEQLNFPGVWWGVLFAEIVVFIIISEAYKYVKRAVIAKYTPVVDNSTPHVVVVDQL